MNSIPDWLPEIIPWNKDWDTYNAKLYEAYQKAYKDRNNGLTFDGKEVKIRRFPVAADGKDECYYHMIGGSGGQPEPERCERILWAQAIIRNCRDDEILVWREPSKHDGVNIDVVLWLKKFDYIVILGYRKNGYWILRSAYPIFKSKRQTLQNAFNRYGPYEFSA